MNTLLALLALAGFVQEPTEGELIHTVSGNLSRGESARFKFQAPEPARFYFIGTCGVSCSDLDLEVWGHDGERLDADFWPDSIPVLVGAVSDRDWSLREVTPLVIEVSMIECHAASCEWTVEVEKRPPSR